MVSEKSNTTFKQHEENPMKYLTKNLMKILNRLFVGVIAVIGLTTTVSAQSTIQDIQSAGVLRVGMADSVPMQYKDAASGEWRGYNVDLGNNLAEVLGVKLEIVDATWATLIPGLMAGRWDIALVDMFATPKRAATVMFTDSYFQTRMVVMGNKNKKVGSWEALNSEGNNIVVLAGTADEQVARDNFPKATVNPMVAEGLAAPILEVAAGRARAIVSSEINMRLYIARNPAAPLEIVEPSRGISAQGYAYAIRPGDVHLLNFLNTWIRSNQATGLSEATKTKWLDNFPG